MLQRSNHKLYFFINLMIIGLIFGTVKVSAQSNVNPQEVVGVWRIENGLDIQIFERDGKFYGKIVALNGFNEGQAKDIYNSKEKHHSRSLIGMEIITDLKFHVKDQVWTGGKMYAPHMGISANLEILKIENNTAWAEGSKFFFWHEEQWKRIKK